MVEILLINFLFLLFPVLIYLIFFENKIHIKKRNSFNILFSAISMILCMTFPIRLEMGFIFDLRYIPFIIASLLGGYKIALPLYVILNLYRFYLEGDGVFLSFLYSTIVFIVVPFLHKFFIDYNSKKRLLTAGSITFLLFTIYQLHLSTFLKSISLQFLINAFIMVATYVIGIITIMALIEKIIENQKAREKLVDSDRLNIISELAASISHEIRNPLTVTNGFLQLLRDSKNITEKEQHYINFSLQELKRAEGIVSDFLSLAKPQAENMVNTDLKEEIDYVNNIMIPYAHIHQVDLQCSFTNTLTHYMDKNQIRQCLINLYKNGIEAMKKDGGTLSVLVSEQNGNIVIQIKDTGCGMSEEEIQQIGKPYYSTKKEGTGLGMMVAYSTIHKLNGNIEILSEKGKGTTFVITIPASHKY